MTETLLDFIRGLGVQYEGVQQFLFFKAIFRFLDTKIETLRFNLLGGIWEMVMGLVLALATIWILWQGWLIMSGRSKESLMGLVVSSLRTVLILTAATAFTFGSVNLLEMFSTTLPKQIHYIVTGDDEDPADVIDDGLNATQAAFIAVEYVAAKGGGGEKSQDTDRNFWLAGVGAAGPMVIGGALLMVYKVALALFVGFGPLFILSLLFEQTKGLFSKWLYYGIGTMFSLAVLAFMISTVVEMVMAVSGAFVLQATLSMNTGTPAGISGLSMQQGGLGLIMTVLLVMTPPMAAMFFNGVLGQFAAYSAFGTTGAQGSGGGRDVAGRMPGQAGYQGTPANAGRGDDRVSQQPYSTSTYEAPNPGQQHATKT